MKRIAGFVLLVLYSALLAYPQNPNVAEEMTGTICDAGCVTHQGTAATCQPTCAKQRGIPVFIDDQGNVRQIMNQDVCKSHMGKRVKMTAVPEKPGFIPVVREREMWLRVQNLQDMPSQ